MKLIVLRQFRDKNNHEKIYQPGDVLETEDKTRISDLKERGLVEGGEAEDVSAGKAAGTEAPAEETSGAEDTAGQAAGAEKPTVETLDNDASAGEAPGTSEAQAPAKGKKGKS